MANVEGTTVRQLAERSDLSYEAAKRFVEEIRDALLAGERVKLRSVGSLRPMDRDSYPRGATVKFVVSRKLKDSIRANFEVWHDDRMDLLDEEE